MTRSEEWHIYDHPRALNQWERTMLDRFISFPSEYAHSLVEQASLVRVSEDTPPNPSCILTVPQTARPLVGANGVPVDGVISPELHTVNPLGHPIVALLELRNGYLYFLAVHRFDDHPWTPLPEPASFVAVPVC
jgi:hypothetical protein